MNDFDLLVIGGGMTGLTAANFAAEHGKTVCCLEAELLGGLIVNIGRLDGYPAAADVSGIELSMMLAGHAMERGVQITEEAVQLLSVDGEHKVAVTDGGEYRARRVILATGAGLKKLGVPGETKFMGRGVSQCAFCDAGFFRDQDVVVVGGGDAALQEALHLVEHCRTVTMICRSDRLRARARYVELAAEEPKFRFRWNTVVEEIEGGDGVEQIRLRDTDSDKTDDLACAGVFVFVGLAPNTEFLPGFIARNSDGFIVTEPSLETATPGLYAAGAARAGYLGQLTNAVGEGTAAAIAAMR